MRINWKIVAFVLLLSLLIWWGTVRAGGDRLDPNGGIYLELGDYSSRPYYLQEEGERCFCSLECPVKKYTKELIIESQR